MRFLLSRRWVLFALAVLVLAYGCYLLGRWQFHRLHDRESANAQIRTNLAAAPVPVDDLLAPGRPVPAKAEWQRVRATGTYDRGSSVLVRYQTRDGASGVDVVTPLRTASGTALLVDRGWMATGNAGLTDVEAPTPPPGRITVVGWVRVDATGDSAQVSDGSTRAISSRTIGTALGTRVYGGFVDAQRESPGTGKRLVPAETPDLGNGPHFFYGLQWWFFGVLAVVGFCYLAWDERRKRQRQRSMPPSTGSITPVTKPAAGDSRNAAARPNSSGRP